MMNASSSVGFSSLKNRSNPSEIMDDMDIDSVVDIPDTPDRLTAQMNKGKSSMERSNLPASGHPGQCNLFVDDTVNGLKVNEKGKRKLLIHTPKRVLNSSKCDGSNNLAFSSGYSSSSSSNKSSIFRRVPDEIPNCENKHFKPTEENKQLHAHSSAACAVDLTERNGQVQTGKRDSRVERYGRLPPSTIRLPSSCGMLNSIITSHGTNKGKAHNEKVLGFDCNDVTGSLAETQPKTGKVISISLNSVSSPRITGQKRLVRNGCISPHNIAKAKQIGMGNNGNIDGGTNHALPVVSTSPTIGVDVAESITKGDSHKSKGKGILITDPLSVEKSDARNFHARNSVSVHEIVKEVGDSNKERVESPEDLAGWRSTSNRSKNMNLPMYGVHKHLSSEKDDPCSIIRHPGNGVTGRKIQSSAGTGSLPLGQDSASSQRGLMLPPRHRVSKVGPQLDQFNGHQSSRNTLIKRQKQRFSSSSLGESSHAALGDTDILFLGSSGDTSTSSSTQTQRHNGLGILEPVINIEEASPEDRGDGSSAAGGRSPARGAMASQIEADEMLARELQEQFYNEVPSFGVGEGDMHVAMALQPEESLTHGFPRSQHVFSPRSSLMPISTRQSQSRSSLNLSRRSPHARGPNLSRMARLRSRFPGRPRTISSTSSRERNSLFPPDMDVDMRMYILEALEAFSDMGVDNSFLQMYREFNENDYEMLLALDENNHQHSGATDRQINVLPQSTVQSGNVVEDCAICLETPTTGDIIRHLPCLHKFHKDCIDPWLQRRTSCPVCKSSIT